MAGNPDFKGFADAFSPGGQQLKMNEISRAVAEDRAMVQPGR